MSESHAQLQRIVLGTPWLVDVLRVVRDVGPPDAYVGAGVVRNVVWDFLDSAGRTTPMSDVDVVFFEPKGAPMDWKQRLDEALPGYRWDVTNQAEIHRWQSRQLSRSIPPYESLEAAIASWPETATAIAVRLCNSGAFAVVAPYGMSDLFNLQLRASPGLTDRSAFLSRLHAKSWRTRWPSLTVHTTSDST